MWTTKITGFANNKTYINFNVEFYVDGVLYTSHSFENISSPDVVDTLISSYQSQLQKFYQFDIPLGDIVAVPPVPTSDEVIINNFTQLRQRELSLVASVKAGSATQDDLDAAIAARKQAYADAPKEVQPILDSLLITPFSQ